MTDSLRKIDLQELMRGQKQVVLQHKEKPYHLSITRRGKLILTAPVSTSDTYKMTNKNLP